MVHSRFTDLDLDQLWSWTWTWGEETVTIMTNIMTLIHKSPPVLHNNVTHPGPEP